MWLKVGYSSSYRVLHAGGRTTHVGKSRECAHGTERVVNRSVGGQIGDLSGRACGRDHAQIGVVDEHTIVHGLEIAEASCPLGQMIRRVYQHEVTVDVAYLSCNPFFFLLKS